jgi:hypothetical protein
MPGVPPLRFAPVGMREGLVGTEENRQGKGKGGSGMEWDVLSRVVGRFGKRGARMT